MQKKVEDKVFAYCEKHRMFEKGDRVAVGVSGGADSVCLLFVLLSLQKELELDLHVVHVNHGIRPDAGEDAAYVRKLCEENGLPFTLIEKDIPAEAKRLGCSEEEAGRMVRYESFRKVLGETGDGASGETGDGGEFCGSGGAQSGGKIAVAHNANDQAETMLFHLFRGTGITGLLGIRPVREQIVRPLLCLERNEIEAYLNSRGIPYRHDSTNDSDDYTRNKIRHHILEYAESDIVQGCVGNMVRSADILAQTEDYIKEQVAKAFETCVREIAGGYEVCVAEYLELHEMLQKRILLEMIKELSPQHKDMGAVHVEALQSLFTQPGNRWIHLPYGIRGNRDYEKVMVRHSAQEATGEAAKGVTGEASDTGFHFSILDVAKEGINCKDIPQNQYTKWFDYDKIKECLEIRFRREGDFLTICLDGELRHKKLKDYMIDMKISPERRDTIALLAEGKHVLWLPGYRISEYYKVSEDTKTVLQVSYEET